MSNVKSYTIFENVNLLLDQLILGVEPILKDNFVACYLFGSLGVGDFDPESSDVDVLIVTNKELNPIDVNDLSSFHEELFRCEAQFSTELECFYVSKFELKNYKHGESPCYKIDRGNGRLRLETLDADWTINSFSLYHHGIVITGPEIKSLIPTISIERLKSAIRELLESWWLPMTVSGKKLEHDGYRFYAILTMARMIASFDFNRIVSKKFAAQHALSTFDKKWKQIIEKALARDPSITIEEVQEFIQYTHKKLS